MGIVDQGWNIIRLMIRECKNFGISDSGRRLIITNPDLSPANSVSEEFLNVIYNTADVGVNTSLGEGWGLVPFEQAACGIPQIVPDHSASTELFNNRGILLPTRPFTALNTNVEGGLVDEHDLADALNKYYYDTDLRYSHAAKMYEYISNPKLEWDNIAKIWDKHLKEVV
jgi:hypothetical protein